MKRIEIVVVRHGQSMRNLATELAEKGNGALHHTLLRQGGEDWPLTKGGRGEARIARNLLTRYYLTNVAAAYTSHLVRCIDTAKELNLGCEWVEDERLRERSWGDFSGEEFRALTVEDYFEFFKVSSDLDWRSPAPGSESIRDRYEALTPFFQEVLAKHMGGRVILCTHGGAMKALQMLLERYAPEYYDSMPKRPTANGCIHHYRLENIDLATFTWDVAFRSLSYVSDEQQEWKNV